MEEEIQERNPFPTLIVNHITTTYPQFNVCVSILYLLIMFVCIP